MRFIVWSHHLPASRLNDLASQLEVQNMYVVPVLAGELEPVRLISSRCHDVPDQC